MIVSLFFLQPNYWGGMTSYTAHLHEGLRRAGHDPVIYRIRPISERRRRSFALYDAHYRNVSPEEALHVIAESPSLLTASAVGPNPDWNFMAWLPLAVRAGMWITIHDPNELMGRNYDTAVLDGNRRVICIRPSMRVRYPLAQFVPHPYVREFEDEEFSTERWTRRPLHAACITNVKSTKRPDVILDANRLIGRKRDRIHLLGKEERLYVHRVLRRRYPEYEGGAGFPQTLGAAAQVMSRARFGVDMSRYHGDGGGSQYTFMETWDAGAVCVVSSDWTAVRGEMSPGKNCLAARGPEDLAEKLENFSGGMQYQTDRAGELVEAGYAALRRHDAARVARKYVELMR